MIAPTVPEPELPEGHFKLAFGSAWAAGTPEGCITYKDRYDKYSSTNFLAEQCAPLPALKDLSFSRGRPGSLSVPTHNCGCQRSCPIKSELLMFNCSGHGWDPNAKIPDSNYIVILRVHHGLEWANDLRLMIRALMVECRNAGLHFWLLHQVCGLGSERNV